MRTLTDATLYVVDGPHGPYYAIRDNESGRIVTERTEQAAARIANQTDMVIVDRVHITHAKLLAMTGSGAAGQQASATAQLLAFPTDAAVDRPANAAPAMRREPYAPTR